ncbi:MAG: class I SAM-dependent methyltransferase [Bacilli bacterium]
MSDITQKVKTFLDFGLVISPWLAGVDGHGRFDGDIFSYLDGQAQSITDLQWTDDMQRQVFGEDTPALDRIPRTALYEVMASTAVWMAHEETGTAEVNEDIAEQALVRVREFCSRYGLADLVQVYGIATQYENYQAIHYYHEMPEREFVLGHAHRPWVDYSLSDELVLGVLSGNVVVKSVHGNRVVSLTEKGLRNFQIIEDKLEETGYLTHRIRQLQVSRFNLFHDFEGAVRKIAPNWIPQRRDFLDWIGIEPGMRVLELGCADGLFTFDGGLAERIGPKGHLDAIDPSTGMLARAEKKRTERGYDWVQFRHGSAESLPYTDGTFDAVVGVAFLHLTDIAVALREMERVTKPGGVVGSFHPLPFGMNDPFFRDWFAPLMELAARNQRKEPQNYFISASEMEQRFREAGLQVEDTLELIGRTLFWYPNENVNVLIRGLGWAQEELATIPWKARETLIDDLEQRGYVICDTYSAEERIMKTPFQMIKGVARS